MNPTQEDCERAGRWLDGEQLELTPDQRALAEEIAADAETVAAALDVPIPGGTLHWAGARLRVNLRRRRRRPMRWAAAAAAAAVIIGAGLLAVLTGEPNGLRPPDYVECFLQTPSGELEARAALLADELAEYQVELAVGEEWPVEAAMKGLEQQLGDFILEDVEAGEEPLWEQPEGSL